MSYLRYFFCLLLIVTSALSPDRAAADDRVAVLEAESAMADADFAAALSGVLRHAARQMPLWQVSDQGISAEEITIALGCESLDVACLSNAAESLEVDIIISATVERQGNRYQVSLALFRLSAGAITGTAEDSIPRVQSDIDDLRPRVARYLDELGARAHASLHVRTGVASAEVLLDGTVVGTTDSDGNLQIPNASPGTHELEVRADGRAAYSTSLNLESNQTLVHNVTLEEAAPDGPAGPGVFEDVNWTRVTSYSLIATSAAMLGVVVWEWLTLHGIDTSDNFSAARDIPTNNVCTLNRTEINTHNENPNTLAVDYDQLQDECSGIEFHHPMQFVFGGLSLVSMSVGLYLLLSDDDDDGGSTDGASEFEFSLHPQFGPRGASVSARLEF
jgi:hypothetical protein